METKTKYAETIATLRNQLNLTQIALEAERAYAQSWSRAGLDYAKKVAELEQQVKGLRQELGNERGKSSQLHFELHNANIWLEDTRKELKTMTEQYEEADEDFERAFYLQCRYEHELRSRGVTDERLTEMRMEEMEKLQESWFCQRYDC